jgi:hypothetical protein
MTEKNYCFICGVARSGTTELRRLIASHPLAAIGVERYISRSFTPQFLGPELFDKDRFFRLEEGDTFYQDLDAFTPYYGNLRDRYDSCVLFGDKIPRLYERYAELRQAFPKLKVLFILRNIFDIADSYNRRAEEGLAWPADRDYRVAVRDWNRALDTTSRMIEELDLVVVEYETLFSGKADARQLLEVVGLDWVPEVESFYGDQRRMYEQIEATRVNRLGSEQKRYLCWNADFDAYRRLVRKAASLGRLIGPLSDVPEEGGAENTASLTIASREQEPCRETPSVNSSP